MFATGKVQASIMRSETASVSLAAIPKQTGLVAQGSTSQSFIPKSLKLTIYGINLCKGESSCENVYVCEDGTEEGCAVELSEIDAFVDALNASPAKLTAGEEYDHIGVSFCKGTSGKQHITVNGTVDIAGTTYATNTASGLVAGSDSSEVSLDIDGGCASFYPLETPVTVSEDEATVIKLFFDTTSYVYAGISGGAASQYDYISSSCAGSADAYVCAPVITVVPTIDSGTPTTEIYLISDTNESNGGSATSAPTSYMALYFNSSGNPIGGVQNAHRISGAEISWGTRMGWGLALFPSVVSEGILSIGEPKGSVKLANWFKNFSRSTHTGTYSYSQNGSDLESTYSAVKL